MRFYKVGNDESDEKARYYCTRKVAHDEAKQFPDYLRASVRIELVGIAIDQQTVADILNGWGATEALIKTWKLTPRGGLVECPNGE